MYSRENCWFLRATLYRPRYSPTRPSLSSVHSPPKFCLTTAYPRCSSQESEGTIDSTWAIISCRSLSSGIGRPRLSGISS